MKDLLIIDDDAHLRALVKTYAEIDGFLCQEAENGTLALDILAQTHFDLIVLDIMMPGLDGFETLSQIRQLTQTPVIILTARKEEYDKLLGFNLGADDYLAKPFSPKELMARIHAILKRSRPNADQQLQFGDLLIKAPARMVLVKERPINLTPMEFDLLLFLSQNNHIVLDRDKILQHVWGYDYYGDTRTVDTHIKSLRNRLDSCKDLIQTVWGVGYKFEYEDTN